MLYIHVSLSAYDYSVYRTLLVSAIDTAQSPLKDDMLIPEISERRALAKEPELPEKTKDDFFDLIDKLDKYNEFKEKQERPERSAGTRWHWLVALNVVYLLLCFLYANSLYFDYTFCDSLHPCYDLYMILYMYHSSVSS